MYKVIIVLIVICFSINLYAQILPEIEDLGLWCVYVETENKEEPTCDVLTPPAGCWGESITNMNIVPCRLFIRTGGEIIYDSGFFCEEESGATIRVRGNTSASQVEKKPYKIKLQKKEDLLFRGEEQYKDKDWLLIKNWGIHGFLGYKMNELLEMSYAPQFRYVNVILNGIYKGTYLLCESVKRNVKCRIDVSKSGYIFEYDSYWWKEDVYVKSIFDRPMHYTFKYPDVRNLKQERLDIFSDYITKVELSLRSEEYIRYLDLESFVLWVIGNDILGNYDSGGSNIFLSKYDESIDSKIIMPCLWDFDGIMGDENQLPLVFSSIHNSFYFKDLFQKPTFVSLYYHKYVEISDKVFSELIKAINSFRSSDYGIAYEQSFEKDRTLWSFYSKKNLDMPFANWLEITYNYLKKRQSKLNEMVELLNSKTTFVKIIKYNHKRFSGIYNLSGEKQNKIKKGINIINGKKFIVNN